MGSAEPFQMGPGYEPATGMRRFISGTPPIVGMLPLRDSLQLIRTVGMPAIRSKSVKLTDFAIQIADEHLAPFGVEVASPRDPNVRGGHVTLEHPDFARIVPELWARGVIPDFRPPSGMRIGLSPLSTSFTELAVGLVHVAALLGGD
jgi:kynureninase